MLEKQWPVQHNEEELKKAVIIEEHNSLWACEFQKLSKIYADTLEGLFLSIEHVGSTAIKDLCAKPILDIDIVITDKVKLPDVIEKLSGLGYVHEGDLGIEGREAFKLVDLPLLSHGNADEVMEHHLYVCLAGSEELKRHIAFRDYLRSNPDKAMEYGELKKELAKIAESRIAYTNGKSAFIHSVISNEPNNGENKRELN